MYNHTYKDIREIFQSSNVEPDLSEEAAYDYYKENAIRTKEELLHWVREAQTDLTESTRNEGRLADPIFRQRLHSLFDDFYNHINIKLLPEPLDNWWCYIFTITERGIELSLAHTFIQYNGHRDDNNIEHLLQVDEHYEILKTEAKLLTLEQFAELHNVGSGTVRQWIRRGKLRCAKKVGTDWRVPDTALKPTRGHQDGFYYREYEIQDPPDEIPDINDYDYIGIYPGNNQNNWRLCLTSIYDENGHDSEKELTLKEKEKVELYLISHPLIDCGNIFIAGVYDKGIYKEEEE